MAKQHIIRIGHYDYACKSLSSATKLLDLLSKLEGADRDYDSFNTTFYHLDGKAPDLKLSINQEVRPKAKALGLPKPKRGTVRCACGHSDVRPHEACPSCGSTYKP